MFELLTHTVRIVSYTDHVGFGATRDLILWRKRIRDPVRLNSMLQAPWFSPLNIVVAGQVTRFVLTLVLSESAKSFSVCPCSLDIRCVQIATASARLRQRGRFRSLNSAILCVELHFFCM